MENKQEPQLMTKEEMERLRAEVFLHNPVITCEEFNHLIGTLKNEDGAIKKALLDIMFKAVASGALTYAENDTLKIQDGIPILEKKEVKPPYYWLGNEISLMKTITRNKAGLALEYLYAPGGFRCLEAIELNGVTFSCELEHKHTSNDIVRARSQQVLNEINDVYVRRVTRVHGYKRGSSIFAWTTDEEVYKGIIKEFPAKNIVRMKCTICANICQVVQNPLNTMIHCHVCKTILALGDEKVAPE